MKRDWLVMSGLIMAVGIILYFFWDGYRRPLCQDVYATPQLQGTVYDANVGKCDAR